MNEPKIGAAASQVEQFLESALYQDFINEIQYRISYLDGLLTDLDLKYSGRDYDMFRGGKKNLLEMIELFPQMLQNIYDNNNNIAKEE
jgi:hypothetical protein